jgi:hypothetical protein
VVDLGELHRAGEAPARPPRVPLRQRMRPADWRWAGLVVLVAVLVGALAWPAGHHSGRQSAERASRVKPAVMAWINLDGPAADSTDAHPHASATLFVANLSQVPVTLTHLTSRTTQGRTTATLFSPTPVVIPAGTTTQTAIDIRADCDRYYTAASLLVGVSLAPVDGLPARHIEVPMLASTFLGVDYTSVLNNLCNDPSQELNSINGVTIETTTDTTGMNLDITNTSASVRYVDFALQTSTNAIHVTPSPSPVWSVKPAQKLHVRIGVRATRCIRSGDSTDLSVAMQLEVSRPDQQSNEPYFDDLTSQFAVAVGAAAGLACHH